MGEIKKILVLENEIEAGLLDAELSRRGIPHIMKSYYDSAMDGLYQAQSGWGHVESEQRFETKIIEIYREMIQRLP
ncbi:MAG: hypothetical protein JXQ30_17250 [Spirochaetes bacterium]|nr:hypothetical protein [Spirochaetota bacterium]